MESLAFFALYTLNACVIISGYCNMFFVNTIENAYVCVCVGRGGGFLALFSLFKYMCFQQSTKFHLLHFSLMLFTPACCDCSDDASSHLSTEQRKKWVKETERKNAMKYDIKMNYIFHIHTICMPFFFLKFMHCVRGGEGTVDAAIKRVRQKFIK